MRALPRSGASLIDASRRRRLLLVAISAVLAIPGAPALPAADAPASSLPELLDALASAEQAVAGARTRLRDATGASDEAWTAFSSTDRAMRERVAAELQRTPALRGAEYLLYTAGLSAEVAAVLPQRRQRLADLQQALAGVARKEEDARLLGVNRPDRLRPFLEYSVALFAGNVRWLELLNGSLGRTEDARAPRERNLRLLRERVSALKRAEEQLRHAQQERFRLLHRLGTEFAPVHVRSVSVALAGDPRANDAWSYRAVTEQPAPATELDREIAFLLDGLADAEIELRRHRDEFLEAEQRFIDVGRRLDAAHAANSDLIRRAYYLRIGEELADSAIGIFKDGGEPAGIFFEAGWRIVEYATTDSYRIDEPKIDESLAAYRDDVARRLGSLMNLPGEPRLLNDEQWLNEHAAELLGRAGVFATTGQRIVAHLRGDQADELVKGAWNTGVVDGVKAFAHTAIAAGWRPDTFKRFLNSWVFEERFNPVEALNRLSEKTVERLPLPENIARWLRGGDATAEVLRPRRNALAEYGKAKVADVALGAAVTAAKEVINAQQQNAMVEAATELALLDIEWFMRRYEYAVRGAVYHAFGRKLAEAEAAVGALFEEKARVAPERTLRVEAGETIATTDALRVRVEFSDGVDEARLRAGGREFLQTVNRQAIVEWSLPAQLFPAGAGTLGITALSRRLGAEFGFDADPTTVARYEAAAEGGTGAAAHFPGFEPGVDEHYLLRFATPSLTIVNPKPGGYLPGDWLDVTCELPGSLGRRRMYLTAYPVQRPVEIALTPGANATTRFPAPDAVGRYRLLLLTPDQSTVHAEAEFTVPVRVARTVGRSAFVRVDAFPLADRGPSFTPPAEPPGAGHGRLAFEIRDAATQLITPRVSVRRAGSDEELAYTYGRGAVELAPGSYDMVVDGAVPLQIRGRRVEGGQTEIIQTGGYGRLTFATHDALGGNINPRISIRRTGEEAELTYTYGGNSVDLPPGSYDVVINAVPDIEHRGVPVEAGNETLVASGGYGRLQLDALDALGGRINPRVSIHRTGEEAEFTYTYGGNFVDLPPGAYDVSYTYTPPIEFRNITVAAGSIATRTAGGYGRLQLDALDALGERINPRVSIRRTGEQTEFTYTYGGNFVDLPPGAYDVSYTYTPPIEFRNITVAAGSVATRTAGGYGRLQINVVNRGGERVGPRISIRRAGSDQEFTYTYGNNFVDLPPGAYLCVHGSGDDEIRAPAVLTRGATTTVGLRVP